MRIAGTALLLVGLVALVIGAFNGCGSLFSWNGRHAVDTWPLREGLATHPLLPEPGRRYTLSVVVVFAREDLPRADDGTLVVEAKMPLVVRVRDADGTSLSEVSGWLDPAEPPSVLYGQASREGMRGPTPELSVARLVGPFTAAGAAPLTVEASLGADRVGKAKITDRRLDVYDDAFPAPIRNALLVAGAGLAGVVSGGVLLVVAWRRRPRKRRREPAKID